jgi:endoglucanase
MASVLAQRWQDEFGFIAQEGIAPVLIGEFGGPDVGLDTIDGRWQRQFLNYISLHDLSWTYWSLNPDSGDTGGILNNDWTTVDEPKLALLQRAMAHEPIAYHGGKAGSTGGVTRGTGSLTAAPVTRPTTTTTTTATRPSHPPPGPAPPPASFTATVSIQSQWQDGWCATLAIHGPDGPLEGRSMALTLPSGTTVTQQWNGVFSATTGPITVQLPAWARVSGGLYDSTGFCVSGTGRSSGVSIR